MIRERLKDKLPQIQTEVIKGNAKSAIVEDSRRFEADLIVVGSHGYGFLERVFLGSVSNAVVHRAQCSEDRCSSGICNGVVHSNPKCDPLRGFRGE